MTDYEEALAKIDRLRTHREYDECLGLCDALLASEGPLAELYYERAFVHRSRDDHASALADIDCAIDLTPAEPAFHFFKGLWLLELDQCREALPSLERCIETDRALDSVYYLRATRHFQALAYLRVGDAKAAVAVVADLDLNDTFFVKRLYRVGDILREAKQLLRPRRTWRHSGSE